MNDDIIDEKKTIALEALEGRRVLMISQATSVPSDDRLWQQANELINNGYQVTIICPISKEDSKSYEILNGISIHRHPLPYEGKSILGMVAERFSLVFWELLFSSRVLIVEGFDIIHGAMSADILFIIGVFFKFFFDKKFLIDYRQSLPELYETKIKRHDLFYKVMFFFEKLTFDMADLCIAANESYRKIVIDNDHVTPEKVFVVRSRPTTKQLRILHPCPALRMGKKYLVAYRGALDQDKGVDYLIEAVRYIVYDLKREGVHFTIVGDGPSLETLKMIAAEKGVSPYITFTGRIAELTLLEILNTADVCESMDEVNPINNNATVSRIVDYMALGKAIVQFDLTEARFLASDASLYAKANDPIDFARKIIELLDNPAKRASMAALGRARVERDLSWNQEAPKLIAAYESVCAQPC